VVWDIKMVVEEFRPTRHGKSIEGRARRELRREAMVSNGLATATAARSECGDLSRPRSRAAGARPRHLTAAAAAASGNSPATLGS